MIVSSHTLYNSYGFFPKRLFRTIHLIDPLWVFDVEFQDREIQKLNVLIFFNISYHFVNFFFQFLYGSLAKYQGGTLNKN